MNPQSTRPRASRRGVTLLEVLVVVAIMSLIAAGVGVASYRYWTEAQVKTATTGARALRGAVKTWWVVTGGAGCPTVAQLVADHVLDEDSPRVDPWGKPWRIECSEDQVSVGSDGRDRIAGTDDDIRVPPLARTAGAAAGDSS